LVRFTVPVYFWQLSASRSPGLLDEKLPYAVHQKRLAWSAGARVGDLSIHRKFRCAFCGPSLSRIICMHPRCVDIRVLRGAVQCVLQSLRAKAFQALVDSRASHHRHSRLGSLVRLQEARGHQSQRLRWEDEGSESSSFGVRKGR